MTGIVLQPSLSRRALMVAAGATTLAGCDAGGGYAQAAQSVWQARRPGEGVREWVRLATLAANGHNTQPWRFIGDGAAGLRIVPDAARRTPVVDPDDHHLWVSLGCAAENLLQAAAADGRAGEAAVNAGHVQVDWSAAARGGAPLADAIAGRHSARSEYDGTELDAATLRQLEAAAIRPGVQCLLLATRLRVERLLDHFVAANGAQIGDPAFVAELKEWLRFTPREALQRRDGLFVGTTGNPALPRWLGAPLFDRFFTAGAENDKLVRQLRSSAGLAVFVAERPGPAGWMAVGRACQRFLLQAAALGLRTAFVNQPVEVAPERARLAAALGLPGRRPDLVLRFGRGPAMPPALRRAPDDVLTRA